MKSSFIKARLAKTVVNKIIFTATIILIIAFFVFLYLFNDNYCKIYNSPEVNNATIDFDGVDLLPRDVACNLSGEWEFFYDKWIVTDGYDGECDGLISVPSLWTYKDYGNGKLPKTGYASYRLIANNVEKGANIVVFRHNENFAYRVYVNGELNYVSGTLSKNIDETVVTGVPSEVYPYAADGAPLEIVIELSATAHGGLNAAPWLAAVEGGVEYGSDLRTFTNVTLGVSVTAVVMSVLFSLIFGTKKDVTLPLFVTSMLVHFITSKDMMYVSDLSFTLTSVLRLLSAIFAFAFFVLHLKVSGIKFKKAYLIATAVIVAVSAALLIAFYGTPISPIFAVIIMITALTYLYPFFKKTTMPTFLNIIYAAIFELLIRTFTFEFLDALGLLKFGTEFIFSAVLALIIACIASLMMFKIAEASKEALRAKALEKELALTENKALKAQIKPHFIYNSQTSIQYQYRKGINSGDEAIEKFARHLRLVTDSKEDLVTFEKEIKSLINYVELENLRFDGKINLLLNLEYTDFKVPQLSLQPLVENAVKYAKLSTLDDGYIEVTSKLLDDDYIEITVSDNGAGFDPETTTKGVGLSNVEKRFALYNASVTVVSEKNNGTKITIRTPKL